METKNFFIALVAILVSNFTVIFIIYHAIKSEKERKLAMIEKGMDPDKIKPKNPASTFKTAILFIGVAIGILAGHVLNEFTSIVSFAAYLSMILLFGGWALLVFYMRESRQEDKDLSA